MSSPILIYSPGGGVPPTYPTDAPVYSQADVTALIEGQDYIDIVFGSVQTDEDWVLVACEVENLIDLEPLNIWPGIITDKTTAGFRIQLNGMPDSGNYYLRWAVSGINIAPVAATSYQLLGPSTGPIHAESSVFTVKLFPSTTLASSVVVTPDDSGGLGVFTPESVTLTAASPVQTFTYTPTVYGDHTISVTNDNILTDPVALDFIAVVIGYGWTFFPTDGFVGVESDDFTVELPSGGVVSGTVTVTPSDGGDGGTFTPTSVELTTASPSATFTYTPDTEGEKTISVTNDGDLIDPDPLTYTATPGIHLLDTLISYWKMDMISGVPDTPDAHGSNTLAVFNGPSTVAGKISNAIELFAASNHACAIGSNASLQVTSDFTFSMWIKLFSQVTGEVLGKSDGVTNEYSLRYDTTNGFCFGTGPDAVASDFAIQGAPVADGVWTHIVAWYDSGDGEVHIRFNDATTVSSTTSPAPVSATGAFVISYSPRINMIIDEVGFWKRVLTAEEITALYGGGSGLPYSSFTA